MIKKKNALHDDFYCNLNHLLYFYRGKCDYFQSIVIQIVQHT